MNTTFSVRKDFFKGINIKLFVLTLLGILCLAPLAPASAQPTAKHIAYAAFGEAYYRQGLSGSWTQIIPDGNDTQITAVSVGENGCLVYQGYSGDLYYKASATSTGDVLLASNTTSVVGDHTINKDCSIAWITVDDPGGYTTSIRYKQTPTSPTETFNLGNSNEYVGQIALDDNGGVAWVDIYQALWYNATPTGTPQQITGQLETIIVEVAGAGRIVWQDANNLVWYKASPSAAAVQLSEPDIAAPSTVSIASTGDVAWTCNTAAFWFRSTSYSTGQKLTADYSTGRGVISMDGQVFLHETSEAGLAYYDIATNTEIVLIADAVWATSIDIY